MHTSRKVATKLGITVLVPTWRRPDSLTRFLDGLEAQRRPPDEVVFSVRADDLETRALLAQRRSPFPAQIATPAAPGLLAALNAGYDAASGDVVVATDDDTVPHPDWLERIEARFAEDPRLGALGGPDRMVLQDHPPDGVPGITVGKVEPYGRVVGNHHLGAGGIRDVDILKGCNLAVRAAALGDRRIDVRLRGNGAEHHTELDLCLGLHRDGWRVAYDPAVIVDHYEEPRHEGSREIGKDTAENHDSVHNLTYALLKHLPPLQKVVSLSYGLLVGTRENPGLVLALERRLHRGGTAPGGSLRAATSARLSAVGTWFRSLR